MIRILKIFIITFLISSCAKEKIDIIDLSIDVNDISRIELRADHKTLIPNGVSQMQFYPVVYAKKMVDSYGRESNGGPFYTKQIEEEFLVPKDRLPADFVKVFDEAGKELKGNVYATTTDQPGKVLKFYAKGGNIKSNTLEVKIREIPDESYNEIVVPVIFHMLLPPATAAPSYDISSEYLEKQLDQVSAIMNRKVTTDPNAGNAKIVFKLATFDINGVSLLEPGKNIHNISAAEITAMGTSSDINVAYKSYILKQKKAIIWDPNKYLNIWLTKFTTSSSIYGSKSYKILAPKVMHSDYELSSIPGLPGIVHKDTFKSEDVLDCLDVGILINYTTFLNPNTQGANEFTLATPIAGYYGILETMNDRYGDLKADGDNDYCPDTYNYDYVASTNVFKNNKLYQQPANLPNRPLEYFTSYNIVDYYSRKNSMSADQVSRMRKVLLQCPSRWSYKSDWAFTGK